MTLKLGKARPLPADEVTGLNNWLARRHGSGVDVARLPPDEQRELSKLADASAVGRGGQSLHLLDDDGRRRYETLVEKAASLPAGAFEKQRREEAALGKVSALARRALRRRPDPEVQEGLLGALVAHLRDGYLLLDQVAIVVFFVGQILEGEAVSPFAEVEVGDDDDVVVVLDPRLGLGGRVDPAERFGNWRQALTHACRNEWLVEEQISAHELRVRLGPRTLKALGRKAAT